MIRTLIAIILFAYVMPAQANDWWSSLWRNADQQGEQLMQQGDASSAAKVYADPRRIAYSKIKSGDYAGAAKDLSSLHDSDSDYNRGNALAESGDLQGAIDAYDAALKTNPNNQDARHNRDLVAQALKQQPPQQQKSGDNKSQDGQKSKGENKSKDDQQSGGDKNGGQSDKDQNSTGKSENNSDKGKNSSAQNNKQSQRGSGQKSKDEQSSEGKQNGQNGSNPYKPKDQNGQGAAKENADQARRDVEASLAQSSQYAKNNDGNHGSLEGASAVSAAMPKSEQQIAQEQWLRSIPDDPGGLLRRKFLIEHMIRQQKAQ